MDLSRRPLRIALIRHGESEANLDKTIFERVPDHAIPLTPHGHEQSAKAGRGLRELFEDEPVRVYVSPYLRARQTLDAERPQAIGSGIVRSSGAPARRDARRKERGATPI